MDKQYYVYSYRDSDNDEVVYIGHGCKGRAWNCGYMKGDTEERNDWKSIQIAKGLLPCDWVVIERRGLSKQEAMDMEKRLIADLRPALNRLNNPNHDFSSVSKEEVEYWEHLRNEGLSYAKIAAQSDYTTMTIWRTLNDN
mgnify:CR=1 FL=1